MGRAGAPAIRPAGGVVAIVGPTATGKSDLALDLAESLDGEIVNADAMQLYRGMDIGTAKVPASERRGIAHHQLDVLEVTDEASVAAYQRHARADLGRIAAAGRRAIVVGGSGLYVRALLDRISFPGTDEAVRAGIQARADELGPGLLHDELARADPAAAERIDRANTRRIVRALEVIELTGEPFSARLPTYTYEIEAVQLGIAVPAVDLEDAIGRRTRAMFAAGLVEETEELLARGLAGGPTAARAVGYAQAIGVVRGELGVEEARDQVALATRQLARRQLKWFRRDPRVTWLEPGSDLARRAHRLCP
ncbi:MULTISPECIES: tRNA (adenosine(37)-N6)-dimethylallyltransferase MiaA [unclassified Pseudactinotalea]|uniref:tRNA (adenosine(37)-N6)-dimethylallyltransferase MiaA n=1 Tax=unclassified Pseudactinotalea TaxID=2649176 RepID=UPI00128C1B6B|nr:MULTISPECIES: tRNA (adenosine(37)-N6)-dimethylallyltransferase MiaA [unclassified Pseudactinotalea]MPV49548.1 tRNA (adenosine(37)-N6)-dimethylallyltransferase MiaA [Pseudactinotalea sp. HY160]QGH69852.1 tRNA (adenosine(37)-N6)-dimethylallyltransferase MiaA [Pseudactinotalea sp. HY158]